MEKHQEEEVDPLAAMPPVPPKATYEPADPSAYDASSRLPAVDAGKVTALSNPSEKERLQRELKNAGVLLFHLLCFLGCQFCLLIH